MNAQGAMCAVGLQETGERYRHPVIHAAAEHLALPLANADDGVRRAVNANLLAERIARAEHIVHDVGADDCNVRRVRVFDFGKSAADFDIQVGDGRHGPCPAANLSVGGGT